MAVAVDQHHIVIGHFRVPDDLVGRGGAVGHEKEVIGIEDARRVLLGRMHRPRMVQQLAQLVHRIADIGPQHVLAEELVKHLPHGALQEGHPARVPRAVPRVGTVVGIVHQRLEERRRQRVQIIGCLADDVARHELRRVLEHVDEAVQLLQDVVGNVLGGARLAEQENGNVGVAPACFANEGTQVLDGHAFRPFLADLLVIDGHDESRRAGRLVGHHGHVVVGEATHHLGALVLDGLGQCTDAQAAGRIGAPVFVDDHDGEAEFHVVVRMERRKRGRPRRLPRIITPALPSACDNRARCGPRDLWTTVRPYAGSRRALCTRACVPAYPRCLPQVLRPSQAAQPSVSPPPAPALRQPVPALGLHFSPSTAPWPNVHTTSWSSPSPPAPSSTSRKRTCSSRRATTTPTWPASWTCWTCRPRAAWPCRWSRNCWPSMAPARTNGAWTWCCCRATIPPAACVPSARPTIMVCHWNAVCSPAAVRPTPT